MRQTGESGASCQMTIVTLVSGCGYAYPGDGTRDGGGQGGRWVTASSAGIRRNAEQPPVGPTWVGGAAATARRRPGKSTESHAHAARRAVRIPSTSLTA